MSNAVICAGCAAGLAVPPGVTGKALRCPRCGTVNTVPGAEPAPPPRVRARREPGYEYDDAPSPRRREEGGVPEWAWGVGAAVVGVGAIVVLGLVLANRAQEPAAVPPGPNPPAPTPAALSSKRAGRPETWVTGTHEASGAIWEFPTTGWPASFSSVVRIGDRASLTFSVVIHEVSEKNRTTPGAHPLGLLRAAAPGRSRMWGRLVESTGTRDGRPTAVLRTQNAVALYAADHNTTYEFTVITPQHDGGEARVKRFFDSVRITKPPPPEPGVPVPDPPAAK
ncbi:hypothetical protein J0H58_12925 [bacterium]|nr:hypothetical protein [bacterium]